MKNLFKVFKSNFVVIGSVVGTTVGCILLIKDQIGGKRYSGKIQMMGKTVVITGATSGIGKELVWAFAERGAKVIMACKDMKSASKIQSAVRKKTFNRNVIIKELDLSSFASIINFTNDLVKTEPLVHTLVLNAAVMGLPKRELSIDGIEKQLATNYLGNFLLTNLLLEKMKFSQPSRIIALSCEAYEKASQLDYEDYNGDKHYEPLEAYNQSKLALVMFIRALAKRLENSGVTANLADPGWLVDTNLQRHIAWKKSLFSRYVSKPIWWLVLWKPPQGAFTPLYCALDPLLSNTSGKYYRNCGPTDFTEVAANDAECDKLWTFSESLSDKLISNLKSKMTNK